MKSSRCLGKNRLVILTPHLWISWQLMGNIKYHIIQIFMYFFNYLLNISPISQPLSVINDTLSLADFVDSEEPPIIRTVGLQRDIAIISPWV